jgi:hypothetical protein
VPIARVFPRLTEATPRDALAFVGDPPMFLPSGLSEVHVSVAFTWDLRDGERLARAWERVAPVTLGGPAFGKPGGEFVPGRYLAPGYTITSRGCPCRCSHCLVPKREGPLREYTIHSGWNVLDDNLLACSDAHVHEVIAMLAEGKRARAWPDAEGVNFSGGLEAARLREWHVELLYSLRPWQMFFAFDDPHDWAPLVRAGDLLRAGGFVGETKGRPHRALRAYVLVGGPGDTLKAAEERCVATYREAGFAPQAMLWRSEDGKDDHHAEPIWKAFARLWDKPAILHSRIGRGEATHGRRTAKRRRVCAQ